MADDLRQYLEAGEALRFEGDLRRGAVIGLTDERLLMIDDQITSIPYENVKEVRVESFDWFLGVMSAALVVFGLVSTLRRPLVGLGFAAAGVGSIWLTYRRRDRMIVDLHNRARPVTIYPEQVGTVMDALDDRIRAFEATKKDQ